MRDDVEIETEGNLMIIRRHDRTLTVDQRERRANEVREIELMYRVFGLPGVRQHGSYREKLDSAMEVVGRIINPPPPDADSPEGRALRIDARTKVDLANVDRVEMLRVQSWGEHYAADGTDDGYKKFRAIEACWNSQTDSYDSPPEKLVPAEGWPPGLTAEKYIRAEHAEADKRAHEVADDDVEPEEPETEEPETDDDPVDPEPDDVEPEPAAPGETAALLDAALKGAN
jgi:hypothetical protein